MTYSNGHTCEESWERGELIDETMHDEIKIVLSKKDRPEYNPFRNECIPIDGTIPYQRTQ